jgi:hypothetical protein
MDPPDDRSAVAEDPIESGGGAPPSGGKIDDA